MRSGGAFAVAFVVLSGSAWAAEVPAGCRPELDAAGAFVDTVSGVIAECNTERWTDVDRGISPTGSPVHESSSTRDHAEAWLADNIIVRGYDLARASEGVFRGEPNRPAPPAWLANAWAQDKAPFEYPKVTRDRYAELGPKRALAEASTLMAWSPERGDTETRAAIDYFRRHPSAASSTITWFQSLWNTFETFDNYPLQAFMYASASPVASPGEFHGPPPAARNAKSPLWRAYERAVAEHLDKSLVDEAYFRAHISDMKAAFASPAFKQIYDLSPPNYRVVVEAYAETIGRSEADLNKGRPAPDISRGLFVDGLRDLVKRKTVGMLWSVEGLKNLVSFSKSSRLLIDRSTEFAKFIATPDRPASSKPWVDGVMGWWRDDAAFRRSLADGKVEVYEIWEITQTLRGFSGILDEKDLARIKTFADANADKLSPAAKHSVQALLSRGPTRPLSAEEIARAPKIDPARGVPVQITDAQRAYLRNELHVEIPDGATTLTGSMFKNASFAEPDRREDRSTPVRRWPLTLGDLVDGQLRHGLTMAGTDGTLQFDEILGGVRNVQARVRSKLIDDFHRKYPVAPGGILQYSANLLTLNKTYGEDEFYGMVPNAIMPVDNDGNPKNQLWRDYANAYEQHKKTGAPSMEMLQKLWIRAHMADFAAVDDPDFQKKADVFWEKAAQDPAYESMAVYAKAMVLGRQVFEKARAEHMTEESALYESLQHFARTVATSGTFPFWKEDGRAILDYYSGERNGPAADDRGLPTDRTIAERAASGFRDMTGLAPLFAKGWAQHRAGAQSHYTPGEMVDLAKILTPAQLASVDPTIVDFFRHPTGYDLSGAAYLGAVQQKMLDAFAMLTGEGQIPSTVGNAPHDTHVVEQDLWRDANGRTHWDRDVVVNGVQRPLFHATFERVGTQVVETFNVRGVSIPLYFDLIPQGHGVLLKLDRAKSSPLAPAGIEFLHQPAGPGEVLVKAVYQGISSVEGSGAEFHIHRH